MNIIKTNNLQFKDIFNDISIEIPKNSIISISGPNNCGKTTLIRILDREIITDNITIKEKTSNNYKIEDYSKIIKTVIPKEIIFDELTLEDYIQPSGFNDYLLKGLNLKKLLKKKISLYNDKEIVLSQIFLSLKEKPEVLLLDCIDRYFNDKELNNIFNFFKEYQEKYNLSIVYTTINLKETLKSDYLYIINSGKVILEGKPLEVLEKDNIINKIGLELPFMIDLSVKLKDYDLIDEIILDMDRMVDTLWK